MVSPNHLVTQSSFRKSFDSIEKGVSQKIEFSSITLAFSKLFQKNEYIMQLIIWEIFHPYLLFFQNFLPLLNAILNISYFTKGI